MEARAKLVCRTEEQGRKDAAAKTFRHRLEGAAPDMLRTQRSQVERITESHYNGIPLAKEERATINRKAKAFPSIVDKINADAAAAETTAKGS